MVLSRRYVPQSCTTRLEVDDNAAAQFVALMDQGLQPCACVNAYRLAIDHRQPLNLALAGVATVVSVRCFADVPSRRSTPGPPCGRKRAKINVLPYRLPLFAALPVHQVRELQVTLPGGF